MAEIDLDQVPYTPVFRWLQQVGSVAEREMLRTFNCGIGMIVVVAAEEADKVAAILTEQGQRVARLGRMEKRAVGSEPVTFSGRLKLS